MLRLNSDTLVFIYYWVPLFIIIPNRESFSSPMIVRTSERGRRQSCTACSSSLMFQSHFAQSALCTKVPQLPASLLLAFFSLNLGLVEYIQNKANNGTLCQFVRVRLQ